MQGGFVEPFTLAASAKVAVAWRHTYPERLQDMRVFLEAIQGKIQVAGLDVFTPLPVIDLITQRPFSKKVLSLLSSSSQDDAEKFEKKYAINLEREVRSFSATSRTLIALESLRPNCQAISIVFGGMDPMGSVKVSKYLEQEFSRHAVLVVFPPTLNSERGEYPDATIDVIPLTQVAEI